MPRSLGRVCVAQIKECLSKWPGGAGSVRHRLQRFAGLCSPAALCPESCGQTSACQLLGFKCFHLGCFAWRWRQSKAPLKQKVPLICITGTLCETQSVGSGTAEEGGGDLFELLVRSLVRALGPSANVGGSSILMSSEWDKGGWLCPKIEEISKMLFWTFVPSLVWAFSPVESSGYFR